MNGRAFLSNLVEFGRVLRSVGIPCTSAQIADVAQALTWVGVDDRQTVFRTARALLLKRREDSALFETVFNRFWRIPDPVTARRAPPRPRPGRDPQSGRFTIATYAAFRASQELEERDVLDRSGTSSDEETLRRKRFADMTDEELDEARKALARFRWEASLRTTRRRAPRPRGRELDLRRLLREQSRLGALPARLPRRDRREKPRPIVLIADISGSMERHARLVLHFFHALTRAMPGVETFVFATRLSRITRELKLRNVDRAMDEAASRIVDWAGGTRIGGSLATFNRAWGRRVLRRGAIVVLVSDGCERGEPGDLAREMRRLRGRCHRLVWLNPHSGHDRYEPTVAGMRLALPFVDDFLPLGNLRSLEDFAVAFGRLGKIRRR